MGEAKRRSATGNPRIDDLTKQLVDKGLLIEAGFASMIVAAYGDPKDMPADQLRELRQAFFAGAQHLYGSMMSFLDPGEDPTTADLSRMEQIDTELQTFIQEYADRNIPTAGSA